MDSLKILTTLTMVFWLPSGCYTNSEGSWCYTERHCGPRTWISHGHCNGKRQSPINIIHKDAIHNPSLGPLDLVGYDNCKKLLKIKNTGKTVDVSLEDGLHLAGFGLPTRYTAKSFHLHWGDGATRPGSEHQINGKPYSMELHIVHTRNNLSIPNAVKNSKGIAVLAFFIQKSKNAESKTAEAWELFAENLKNISEKGEDMLLNCSFSLMDLMGSSNFSHYYRYLGSLTTPSCDEAVIWTVFADPILVSPEVVRKFASNLSSTESSKGPRLMNNFRPIQKIGERKVEVSDALKSAATIFVSPPTVFILFLSIATFQPFFSM
ncbi:carbonic anhydrase 4-like [Pantherophis guttatus]|uniref:Carbonic anhydrase n=1 Tax=Pantherophis guttatus TaxID=94885 RepID=A0A6P9BWT1_PANGU|nr:carbonic anhydrase 4-like [Pantherophis guttatus]